MIASCATKRSADNNQHSPTRIAKYYHETTDVREIKVKKPDLYHNGKEIREKMLDLINGAKDYILIDCFLVSSVEPAREVLDALKAKQREGVRVYILVDSVSRHTHEKDAFDYLKKNGIPYTEYNPLTVLKLFVAPVLFVRDHRKFWVVDGKMLFLGGANINSSSLSSSEDGGNRDYMIAIESPDAVSEMVNAFVKSWNKTSSLQLDRGDFLIRGKPSKEVSMWLFNQQFDRDSASVIPMVDGLFSSAQEEIWILHTYTIATP